MKFRVLDAEIGQVIYQRKNDVVMAAKVLSYTFGKGSSYENSYVDVMYPTGEMSSIYIGKGATTKFYASIESCIEGAEPIDYFFINGEDIVAACGMKIFDADYCGIGYFAVKKWKWDGYKATEVNVDISYFVFTHDENGLHYAPKGNKIKYYDTKEECIADNFVKVVTF